MREGVGWREVLRWERWEGGERGLRDRGVEGGTAASRRDWRVDVVCLTWPRGEGSWHLV